MFLAPSLEISSALSAVAFVLDSPERESGEGFQQLLVELELELIQTQMAQKPMLRAEVGMRVRCANKASAE